MAFDPYKVVTNAIISAIEKGAGNPIMPWPRDGTGGIPINTFSQNPYTNTSSRAAELIPNSTGTFYKKMHCTIQHHG